MTEQYPPENDPIEPYPQAPPPVRNEVRWVLRYRDRDNPNAKIVLVESESVYEPHGTLSLPGGVREIGETPYGALRRTYSMLGLEEKMPDSVPLGVVKDPDARGSHHQRLSMNWIVFLGCGVKRPSARWCEENGLFLFDHRLPEEHDDRPISPLALTAIEMALRR